MGVNARGDGYCKYHLFVSHGHHDGGFMYKGSFSDLDGALAAIAERSLPDDAEIMENDPITGELRCTYNWVYNDNVQHWEKNDFENDLPY